MKADLEDANFMQAMEQLLGMNDEAVESLLDELDADALMALTDAVAKKNKAAAEKIVAPYESEINALFRAHDKDQKKPQQKQKKHPIKPPDDHIFQIGDDVAIKEEDEDTGEVSFVSATIDKPEAPGDTIGVKIEGEPKMVDRDKVYNLKEMIMGMIGVPNIQRMQQLAGIQEPEENSQEGPQVEMEPAQAEQGTDTMSAAHHAMCALDALEDALPNVRLADLKSIRQRIADMQAKMNESIVAAQPAGRSKKI